MQKYAGKSILLVYAHPDDEAYGSAGTSAKYRSLGAKVHLITATRGEAGPRGNPPLSESKEELAKVREEELRRSCEVIGIEKPIILGYPDGGVAAVPREEAVPHLARIIRELRPTVVVTFDEDGITGHPDHIAIGRFATEAFFSSGEKNAYPEGLGGLKPYLPERLYYRVLPREAVERAGRKDLRHREEISTIVDVAEFVDRKLQALRRHRSQVNPTELENPGMRALLSREHYFRFYPRWEPGMGLESELLP